MKTTLNLDDDLIRAAKERALKESRTLTSLIDQALRQLLASRTSKGRPVAIRLVTKRGRLLPGVNLADRDSLYDRMEGR